MSVCTPRTSVVSSLGWPGAARLGQTQLRPWADLSQWTDWSPSWLFFNKCPVCEYLCNKYIQLIRYSGIRKEHFSIKVKIAKGCFLFPAPPPWRTERHLDYLRDVLVFSTKMACLILLLHPVQKTTISQMKGLPRVLLREPLTIQEDLKASHFHLSEWKRTIKRHITITWTGWFWQNHSPLFKSCVSI